MSEHAPILLVELLLVGGAVGLFAWWQFRDLAREREKTRRRREQEQAQAGERPPPGDGAG